MHVRDLLQEGMYAYADESDAYPDPSGIFVGAREQGNDRNLEVRCCVVAQEFAPGVSEDELSAGTPSV